MGAINERDEPGPARPRRRRETFTERRTRRAEITDPAVVLEAAARFLEVRPRSVDETRRHLRAAGYTLELVAGAVGRLIDLGILDDEAFARAWVESRDRAHPRGERALRRELLLKGIDRRLIEVVLADRASGLPSADGEEPGGSAWADAGRADERAAERLLARNGASLARIVDPRRRRQRAYALLVRHGFDSSTAASAAARVVEDEDGDRD